MNDLHSYKSRIRANFMAYDEFLEGLRIQRSLYDICFALRTPYAVYQEIYDRQGGNTLISAFKQVLKLILKLFTIVFLQYSLTERGGAVLLGKGERDRKVAEYLGMPLAQVRKTRSFARMNVKNVLLYPVIIQTFFILMRSNKLNKRYVLAVLLGQVIDAVMIHEQIDLEGVRAIITENDIETEMVSVLQKAKKMSINTVKIEYVLIDDTHHNNVFCDHYFYPSKFHRSVREKFAINKDVRYIEGGFPNWDVISRYTHAPRESPRIICFFTQHGDLSGEQDELFYIEELLSLIDEQYIIHIKLHPLDRSDKYKKYRYDSRCKIIDDRSIDNYELIARSYLCISMFSVISLEAKLICNRSIFLDFAPPDADTVLDYRQFDLYFDVIRRRETLLSILRDEYPFKTRDVFLKNVCMTYPETRKALMSIIHTLSH